MLFTIIIVCQMVLKTTLTVYSSVLSHIKRRPWPDGDVCLKAIYITLYFIYM